MADEPKYKKGDKIAVDLTGLYLAFCTECGEECLRVPEAAVSCECGGEVMRLRDIDFELDVEYPNKQEGGKP